MLSKDLTPNPKAVNIIRPSTTSNNNFQFISHNPQQAQLNYSSSTDSSCTFSTASTNNYSNNTITLSPMIRQPSIESNPGLSFFCQTTPSQKNNNNKQHQQQAQEQQQRTSFIEKVQSQPPLVISRINLTHRRPTTVTVVTTDDLDNIDDDDGITTPTKEEVTDNTKTEDSSSKNMIRLPSFKPGFGIMSGTGLGSFMLRGNIAQQSPPPSALDEARVNRKIEDLEIEKNSLLTLNHTLETVVKEQSTTISNLQDRLAAIERPLTPGLDTSLSKNGIMSSADILGSDDLERYLEDEDAAFERIRIMLLDLIEQAQSAVTTQNIKKVSGRVLSDYDISSNTNNRVKRHGGVRPKSVTGDYSSSSSNTRNIPNHQQGTAASSTRRVSVGSIHSLTSNSRLSSSPTTTRQLLSSSPTNTRHLSSSPTTSPIPTNRRYSLQRSVSRSSSPAVLKKSSSNSSMQSATSRTSTTTKHSKLNIKPPQDSQQTRKWQN